MQTETRRSVPITAGRAPVPPVRTPRSEVRTRRRPRASLGALLVAFGSIAAGVGALNLAQRVGLVNTGQRRPVTSTLLTEVVAPWASLAWDRVARIGEGSRPVAQYAHLRVDYAVSHVEDGALRIEARLADQQSGEVLERFVTWRRE